MIAIIDYKAGNLASVSNALKKLDADFIITADIPTLENADGIIFPGVGHAKAAMEALSEKQLDTWLPTATKPVLGICLGMQLLFSHSEEGNTRCLNILPGNLVRFKDAHDKVPHMGWNVFDEVNTHPLLEGLSKESWFYYVHSYFAPVTEATMGTCTYAGVPFSSIVAHKNFMGVQFHPEKSGKTGEKILSNFLKIVQKNRN